MSATISAREHLAAARAGAAICARDELALVRVAGRDAARLLQNVVTSDIDALAVGEGQYGLALTPKGKALLPVVHEMRRFGHQWLGCGIHET